MRYRTALLLAPFLGLIGCETGPGASPTTQPAMNAVDAKPTTRPMTAFGPAQKLTDAESVPVQAVLKSPDQYAGKYVRMTGIVESVCPAKGCWLRFGPEPGEGVAGGANVFVKFADPPEGRLIPMDAVGHDVVVEGVVKNGKMSEAQAKHLKQDAGASQAEIDAIVGPQPQVTVGQPAVTIEGVSAPGK